MGKNLRPVSERDMPNPIINLKVYKKLNTCLDISRSNETEHVSLKISAELCDPRLLDSPIREESQYLEVADKYKIDQDLRAKRQDRL